MQLSEVHNFVSSAYISTSEASKHWGGSLTQSVDSTGPKIDSCGTPRISVRESDNTSEMAQV